MLYRRKVTPVLAIQWRETERSFYRIRALATKQGYPTTSWIKKAKVCSLLLDFGIDGKSYARKGDWIVDEHGHISIYENSSFRYLFVKTV